MIFVTSLRCEARGNPMPSVVWKREDGKSINLSKNESGITIYIFFLVYAFVGIFIVKRFTKEVILNACAIRSFELD